MGDDGQVIDDNTKDEFEGISDTFDEILDGTEEELEDETTEDVGEQEETDDSEQEAEAESTDEDAGESESEDDGYEPIPDHLVAAARETGLSDADIIKLSEESPHILEALATSKAKSVSESQRAESTEQEQVLEEPKFKKLEHETIEGLDDLDENAKKVVDKLVANQNTLIDNFNKTLGTLSDIDSKVKKDEASRQLQFVNYIDGVLDKIDDVPEIGKADTLTPEQERTRKTIYSMAVALKELDGSSLENALVSATNAFTNRTGKEAESTLRRKLDKSKKKFTARPGGQKSNPKHKNEEEAALDVINDKMKEYGIDMKEYGID
jgi:hypothetical protein